MKLNLKSNLGYKIIGLLILSFVIGFSTPNISNAAEQKDKSARRAALMMQKMKQDMEAEKATMQTQFDTQKKALEDALKVKDEAISKLDKQLISAERKAKSLQTELKKTKDEKTLVEAKLLQTQTNLETTQKSLADLQVQHTQALADLKFNDNQRKTLSTNLADTTKSLNICADKNTKLHQFGTELIQIYDKPSSYDAMMRKEQFFQLKRVELENILQNQQDKLDDVSFKNSKLYK